MAFASVAAGASTHSWWRSFQMVGNAWEACKPTRDFLVTRRKHVQIQPTGGQRIAASVHKARKCCDKTPTAPPPRQTHGAETIERCVRSAPLVAHTPLFRLTGHDREVRAPPEFLRVGDGVVPAALPALVAVELDPVLLVRGALARPGGRVELLIAFVLASVSGVCVSFRFIYEPNSCFSVGEEENCGACSCKSDTRRVRGEGSGTVNIRSEDTLKRKHCRVINSLNVAARAVRSGRNGSYPIASFRLNQVRQARTTISRSSAAR